MVESTKELIKENIREKFSDISHEHLNEIVSFVINKGQYKELDDYRIFRLFNSVSKREEVFIGNVLFNDYISKLLLRTYRKYYDENIALIHNDLENFYYFVKIDNNKFSLEELEKCFREYFEENLEELFFGDEDLDKGIYGDFGNLLLPMKPNYISLPFTLIPQFYEEKFKMSMIQYAENNFNLQESLKLFTQYFCATSLNYEDQSPEAFLGKLVIANIITNLDLYKKMCKFNYYTDFKMDLIKKRIQFSENFNNSHKKIIKKYIDNDINEIELEKKLKDNLSKKSIKFIIKVKQEKDFIKIIKMITLISSDQKLIQKLKEIEDRFNDLNITNLSSKPKKEYEKYIKYVYRANRYDLTLLYYLERFVKGLKDKDEKSNKVQEIKKEVNKCWEIVTSNNYTKKLFDLFCINTCESREFFYEIIFKQNNLYKVIFKDYVEIKPLVSLDLKNNFFDTIKNLKISTKQDLILKSSTDDYIKGNHLKLKTLKRNYKKTEDDNVKCCICFQNKAKIEAKNLITGDESFKFVNSESKIENNKRICNICGIYIWLKLKYLGTYSLGGGNVYPEKRNIVFFYGHIPQERVNRVKGILHSLNYSTKNPSIYKYNMLTEAIEELEQDKNQEDLTVEELLTDLIEDDEKDKKINSKVPPTIWSWYKDGQKDDKVKTHIFSIGQGKNKLYAFVLPYAVDRSDKLQKKLSQNRVAVYSMFSFLARLVGVKGNFYYLSTPKLTDEIEEESAFYYKDKKVEDSLEEYELLTEVAWNLVDESKIESSQRESKAEKAFKERLKLAKNLEQSPLITISNKIYRLLLGNKKGNEIYKNLSSIQEFGIPNLFPLIKVSNKIRKGVKFMGQQIDGERLKRFTEDLFSELVLISGLFPKSFKKSPTEFEKYPRLLIKHILKYDSEDDKKNVLVGYKEWMSKILHSAKGSNSYFESDKEKIAKRLENVEKIVLDNEDILADKINLLYLKRSLFGWITEFLYPLYELTKKINLEVDSYTDEQINKTREGKSLNKIKQRFKDMNYDFDKFFELAKELLKENENYYKTLKENEGEEDND
ncbi:hypothetical protein [Orenia marismortui]|uniref:Uncharacterized protein n=1 Tax=Orenia marismortui TaxID=46469 RepID=A0A4R8HG69_9FIRM|nr:hypothetical protein [Orenia marismortui]TDX59022.1 hypothetical protein C7959_102160 [Orenia marismortui]